MALKHEYGQYFTEEKLTDEIIKKSLTYINNVNNVLEPSYGDGQFIKSLLKIKPNLNIDAYEIDPEVFIDIENSNCILGDFLFSEISKKYSLIIGNPPYIELVYSFYDEKTQIDFKKKYGKKGRGRINLVHAFFDKSFELLEDEGIISFLLPSSFLTSPWYNDIREKIYHEFEIKELIEDVQFKGVSIQVLLLIIKKIKSNEHNYIIKKNNVYQITNKKTNQINLKTIKDFGFKVGVGNYCWSHYKELLNNDEIGYKVLYSSFISDNQIIEIENRNKDKKSHINLDDVNLIQNAIVFPRTSSKKIRFSLIENNEYVFENHIIYVTHENIDILRKLYNFLIENTDEVEKLLNSTNLTKTEVENILCNID
jgi:hypothetical protein